MLGPCIELALSLGWNQPFSIYKYLASEERTLEMFFLEHSLRTSSTVFAGAMLLWSHYVESRQLARNNNEKLPKGLTGIITKDTFVKAQRYNKEKRVFRLVNSSLSFVLDLVILFYVSPFLFVQALSWSGHSEVYATIIWSLLSSVLGMLIALPMQAYSDFVIEERNGFNKKTMGLFVTDALKGLSLNVVFTLILVPCLLWVVKWAGPNVHWWVWGFAQTVLIIFIFIFPVWIQPLFNKFEPLQDEALRGEIEQLAIDHSFPLTKLFQVDGSKRSSHSNAYLIGFWKNKRIVLYDTLLTLPRPQILAVLCHEIGHWYYSHMLLNLLLTSAYLLAQFWSYSIFVVHYGDKLLADFGFPMLEGKIPFLVGLTLFGKIFAPCDEMYRLFMTVLSRKFEFQADSFAANAGRGKDLGLALKSMQNDNLSEMDPDWLYSWVSYSHPPLLERLRAIEPSKKTRKMKAQ